MTDRERAKELARAIRTGAVDYDASSDYPGIDFDYANAEFFIFAAFAAIRREQIEADARVAAGASYQRYDTPVYDDIGMQKEEWGGWAKVDDVAAAIRAQGKENGNG